MKVVFVTKVLTHYRVPFHERVRDQLAERGVEYILVYGDPSPAEAARGDLADVSWGRRRPVRELSLGSLDLVWQGGLRDLATADLVVIGQENRLLLNYLLQSVRRLLKPKVALWGHGRNYQSLVPNGIRERWKASWTTRADWWFAYTARTKADVVALGYPADRVTVFNNSIDTAALREQLAAIDQAEIDDLRRRTGLTGDNVCIYVGGLYPQKRLAFLIEAAERVRRAVPDFELVMVGAGEELDAMRTLAATRDWLHIVGPKFGGEKAAYMRAAKLFLMPGLVGLAVLDAGCARLPVVTTAFPYHSPEIEYLVDGVNGVIVADWQNVDAYAGQVVDLLRDGARLAAMASEAGRMAQRYTLENMATSFVAGVVAALGLPVAPPSAASAASAASGKQRVLVLNNMVTPYTARLLNALASRFDLSVVSCTGQEANRNWGDHLEIRFAHRVLRGFALRLSSSRFAHFNRGVRAAIGTARPDVVVINGFFPTMFAAALAARARRIPFLIQVDGWAETMPRSPYHAVVRRLMIGWCAGAIVCSEKGAAFFEDQGLDRDAIFVAPLVPAWERPAAVARFGDRPYDLLWIAQINDDVKNAAFFVRFVAALHARSPLGRVRVVGDGRARRAMLDGLAAIPVEVDHSAHVRWDEVEDVFSSAKLMALPSIWEPWGLVCNEAMQCGTPCIVSPHVGAAGELVTGANGFIEPLDPERWAAAAASVLDAPDRWAALSAAARASAARVTFDTYLDQHSAAIVQAARRHARA